MRTIGWILFNYLHTSIIKTTKHEHQKVLLHKIKSNSEKVTCVATRSYHGSLLARNSASLFLMPEQERTYSGETHICWIHRFTRAKLGSELLGGRRQV